MCKDHTFDRNLYTNFYNAYLFKGSENILSQEWDWTCEFICKFDYFWYPFDTQNCPITKNSSQANLKIIGQKVGYSGPHSLGKYYFKSINFCLTNKHGEEGFFIDFTFQRPVLNNLITMFLPTGILLLISQMTTVFSKTFMDLVIEVNTTLLLVLTTL